jgi:hypothetical protein
MGELQGQTREQLVFATQEELFALLTRVYCDTLPPGVTDAVCFVSETAENETAAIESAARIWREGLSRHVAVSGYLGCEKEDLRVSGYQVYVHRLVDLGVRREYIHVFPLSNDLPACTDSEMRGLIFYSHFMKWRTLIVTAPPLHQFRAFMSLASPLIKNSDQDLLVWNAVGPAEDYSEEVVFSQSAPRDSRDDLLGSEIQKVIRYFEKGDHVSAREALGYLVTRDRRAKSNIRVG